jgi:hypothetical protein
VVEWIALKASGTATSCGALIREESTAMPGKRVQFDDATWAQIDLLARENRPPFQELADEAFADLLAKYDRSVDLKTQLLKSAGEEPKRKRKVRS